MAAPPTLSSDAARAEAYVGSLISLTSKSEMRYEGFMYQLNARESTIALTNVRSLGTEGRRLDTHVAPSEKIYDYICFRGSDIKDLQVISSPPVRSSSTIPDDPAIIQSHSSHPPANISLASPNALGGSSNTNLGVQVPPFQGNMTSLQPVEVSGSWASIVPAAQVNISGPAMQSYWPGFTGLPGGNSHFLLQPLPPPPPGSLLANPIQLQSPHPSVAASLAGNALNFVEPPRTLLPPVGTGSLNLISTISPPSTAQYSQISLPLFCNLSSTPQSNTASIALQTEMVQSGPQMVSSSLTSSDIISVVPIVTNQAHSLLGPAPFPMISRPFSSTVGISSTSHGKASGVTPANSHSFQHHGVMQQSPSGYWKAESSGASAILPSAPNVPPSDSENVDESAMQLPKSPTRKGESSSHSGNRRQGVGRGDVIHGGVLYPPQIYRAPVQGRGQGNVPYGSAPQHFQTYRGRPVGRESAMIGTASYPLHMAGGQGRGFLPNTFPPHHRHSRAIPEWVVSDFSEDFDFQAMNEKFNKEELWGLLGKQGQKDGSEEEKKGDQSEADEDEARYGSPKVEQKSGYSKDDFFDTISCAAHDGESRREKANSSEAGNIDAENFGEIQRAQHGRGFQGPARGWVSRGTYRGRGYDNSGRSRGKATWSRVA